MWQSFVQWEERISSKINPTTLKGRIFSTACGLARSSTVGLLAVAGASGIAVVGGYAWQKFRFITSGDSKIKKSEKKHVVLPALLTSIYLSWTIYEIKQIQKSRMCIRTALRNQNFKQVCHSKAALFGIIANLSLGTIATGFGSAVTFTNWKNNARLTKVHNSDEVEPNRDCW